MRKYSIFLVIAICTMIMTACSEDYEGNEPSDVVEVSLSDDGLYHEGLCFRIPNTAEAEVMKADPKYFESIGFCQIPSEIKYNNICYRVTRIADGAFKGCKGLNTISIPTSVLGIGNYAFQDCAGLNMITIPNSVKNIGGGAFYDCTALSYVSIPSSVTNIGSSAFAGCESLTLIEVQDGNTVYDSRSQCNGVIETATNTLICGSKYTVIPSSVTSIGDGAFEGIHSLTSMSIPSSVTRIGATAFYGCTNLTSMTLPESVTSIGDGAFLGCTSMSTIELPNSLTSIGATAFYRCSALRSITIPRATSHIGDGSFDGCSSLKEFHVKHTTPPTFGYLGIAYNDCILYVPDGSKAKYEQQEPWNRFKGILEE